MAQLLEFLTGIETVVTAGTRVQFTTTDTFVRSIIITANIGNVAGEHIVVGEKNVVGAAATRRGHPLAPGESLTIDAATADERGLRGSEATKMINIADLYVDSVSNDELVSWIAFR